jgi:DNA-binding NtrC family response regulator
MLSGLRVLVVEDEAVIAEDIGDMIREAEGEVVGPFASVRDARAFLKNNVAVDAAVLDLSVNDGTITPVLESLCARAVPVVVYSGGALPEDVRHRHPDLIALSKPVHPARLIAELRRAKGQVAVATQM